MDSKAGSPSKTPLSYGTQLPVVQFSMYSILCSQNWTCRNCPRKLKIQRRQEGSLLYDTAEKKSIQLNQKNEQQIQISFDLEAGLYACNAGSSQDQASRPVIQGSGHCFSPASPPPFSFQKELVRHGQNGCLLLFWHQRLPPEKTCGLHC